MRQSFCGPRRCHCHQDACAECSSFTPHRRLRSRARLQISEWQHVFSRLYEEACCSSFVGTSRPTRLCGTLSARPDVLGHELIVGLAQLLLAEILALTALSADYERYEAFSPQFLRFFTDAMHPPFIVSARTRTSLYRTCGERIPYVGYANGFACLTMSDG